MATMATPLRRSPRRSKVGKADLRDESGNARWRFRIIRDEEIIGLSML